MTFSSRSTQTASRQVLALLGLALPFSGCTRKTEALRPNAVYVRADELVVEHPQWADVRALDREAAALRGFVVPAPRVAQLASLHGLAVEPEPATTHIAELEARIRQRMDSVYATQAAALAERLRKIAEEKRAPFAVGERAALEAATEAEIQRYLDEARAVIPNLGARVAAYDSLIRTYQARGWDAKALEQARKPLADQMAAKEAWLVAQITDAIDRFVAGLKDKERAETAQTLRNRGEIRTALDGLQAEKDRQEQLLLEALREIGTARAAIVPPQALAAPPMSSATLHPPTLSQPDLGAAIRSIEARRAVLSAFVLRNTRALVRSAAARRGLSAEFSPKPGMLDRTADFRAAVRAAASGLEGSR